MPKLVISGQLRHVEKWRQGAVSDFVEARVELFIPRRAAQHVATHRYALQPCEAQAEPAPWDDGTITHDGSMVLVYMLCHGSHQYTPFLLALIYQHHGSVMGNTCNIIYAYIYIYYFTYYINFNLSGERVWSPQCSWTRTLLGGLWNVHNFCETCTTAGKRAQHLWHVHNISDTCTTSQKRANIEYLKTLGGGGETLYALNYIYIYYHYIYIYYIIIYSDRMEWK